MTREELHGWATQVAKDHGVELCETDGQSVLRADALDGYRVAFRAHGVRGRQFVATEIRANALESWAKRDMRAAIEALVSIVAIPLHVRITGLGAYCDAHGYSDDKWPIVMEINRAAWTCRCSIGATHDMPDTVGLMSDGVYRVEHKPA